MTNLAARFAMTQGVFIAPLVRHRAPHLVIARNEAIHCGRYAKTWIATALRASQ
jgi:hypothetical protein